MVIKIENEIIEIENDLKNLNQAFFEIEKICKKNNWQIAYFLINEKRIANNDQEYFEKNIHLINEIVVVVNHLEQLIDETLNNALNYVENAVIEITKLAEFFYRKPGAKEWKQLADLFEGIEWLIDVQEKIDEIKNLDKLVKSYKIWNELVLQISQLKNEIKQIGEAMENQDLILIGDLLNYEIFPIFQKLSEKLELLSSGDNNHVS